MKVKVLVFCFMGLLYGCEQSEPIQSFSSSFKLEDKWLNPQIKKRFVLLSSDPSETRLTQASPLEFVNGEVRDMINCLEIEATKIEQIIEREQRLLVAAKTDCKIARRYIEAAAAKSTNLPVSLDQGPLLSLPADLIPAINFDSTLGKPGGNLGELNIKSFETTQQWEHTIALEDAIFIKLTEVARADFDQDGVEDLMLMSEWQVADAWDGQGTELLIIEDDGHDKHISWRYNGISY